MQQYKTKDETWKRKTKNVAFISLAWGFPSLRLAKFLLYEVMMVFLSPCFSARFHCPMHGPHALARTVAPASSNVAVKPSRVIVART